MGNLYAAIALTNDLIAALKLGQSVINSFAMDQKVITKKDLQAIRDRAVRAHEALGDYLDNENDN